MAMAMGMGVTLGWGAVHRPAEGGYLAVAAVEVAAALLELRAVLAARTLFSSTTMTTRKGMML